MAYGDPGQRISDLFMAAKQAKESSFFGNLLQYGMNASGEFDIVNGEPVYSGGEMMPDKTELWNDYVKLRGGRVSPQDIQTFESQYAQALAMKTQKQMEQINKLSIRGVSDKKIKKSIEKAPELYNSLMDLVSDLESSGDEQAFAQAQMVRQYLPDTSPSVIEGLVEDPGMLGRVGLPVALAGGAYGAQYLSEIPQEQIDAAKKARADRASINKEINEQKAKLKGTGRRVSLIKSDLATANKNLNLEEKKHLLKRNDQKIKDLRKKVADLTAERNTATKAHKSNQAIQKKIDALEANRKGIKIVKPESRYATLMKKMPKSNAFSMASPGGILGYAALGQGGALGEYLGGETGREVGRGLGNLGILGMLAKGAVSMSPWGRVAQAAFAIPSLIDLYQQSQGK
tara:strand:- start:8024 stop:9226 length:1203 start_codon:yes stop_codon:yes gene_type:complete